MNGAALSGEQRLPLALALCSARWEILVSLSFLLALRGFLQGAEGGLVQFFCPRQEGRERESCLQPFLLPFSPSRGERRVPLLPTPGLAVELRTGDPNPKLPPWGFKEGLPFPAGPLWLLLPTSHGPHFGVRVRVVSPHVLLSPSTFCSPVHPLLLGIH